MTAAAVHDGRVGGPLALSLGIAASVAAMRPALRLAVAAMDAGRSCSSLRGQGRAGGDLCRVTSHGSSCRAVARACTGVSWHPTATLRSPLPASWPEPLQRPSLAGARPAPGSVLAHQQAPEARDARLRWLALRQVRAPAVRCQPAALLTARRSAGARGAPAPLAGSAHLCAAAAPPPDPALRGRAL